MFDSEGTELSRAIVVERIDGTSIKNEKEQTGPFSRDGVDYRIDLKAKNAKNFHSTLTLYIDHAIRVGGRMHGRPCGGRKRAKEIREWPTTEGHELSTRWHIPIRSGDRTVQLTAAKSSRRRQNSLGPAHFELAGGCGSSEVRS
ncbi:histone-like nucleoid-structuring protein Lsr2 [Rhodococcus sp. NPDC057014]|uniref:Lsr2 dimerization domain-containing protein n=1 Tax=Rhodococcus sp. NPDC057014 TaxID=3346000 RepID=UPI003639E375